MGILSDRVALKREFENITIDDIGCNTEINERMDKYLESNMEDK